MTLSEAQKNVQNKADTCTNISDAIGYGKALAKIEIAIELYGKDFIIPKYDDGLPINAPKGLFFGFGWWVR